jgi:hypothetical protein
MWRMAFCGLILLLNLAFACSDPGVNETWGGPREKQFNCGCFRCFAIAIVIVRWYVCAEMQRFAASNELGGAWKIGGEAARATMYTKFEASLSIKQV